jgi:hypothetical protein
VANGAANRIEECVATCYRSCNRAPAWRACGRHEIGECEYVSAIIFRIGYWIEWSSSAVYDTSSCTAGVLGKSIGAVEWIRDAHLIEISVTGE